MTFIDHMSQRSLGCIESVQSMAAKLCSLLAHLT